VAILHNANYGLNSYRICEDHNTRALCKHSLPGVEFEAVLSEAKPAESGTQGHWRPPAPWAGGMKLLYGRRTERASEASERSELGSCSGYRLLSWLYPDCDFTMALLMY
jgi:hypothetical protein